jgi:hypothetical protein
MLRKNSIEMRPYGKRMKYNENFFTNDSDELYYFWGFILGDGHLYVKHKRNILSITIQQSDVSILENFCKWLKIANSNIKHYKQPNGRTYDRFCIYSNYLNNDLSKYGIVLRKTYNPTLPDIPTQYIKPFILGLLDADGHMNFPPNKTGKNNFGIELVGHPLIMDWYMSKLTAIGYSGYATYQYPKNVWKRVRIRRKENVLELIKLLEVDKYFPLLLDRKWHNANDWLTGKLIFNNKNKPIYQSQ